MLSERLLVVLRERPGLKAKELAKLLGADKSEINSALHHELRNKVVQDNSYRWRLRSAEPVKSQQQAPSTKSSYSDLFRYYLECLAVDNTAGVSVFADGKYELDYVELEKLPLDEDVVHPQVVNDVPIVNRLIARSKRERRWTLSVGYPLRVRQHRARSGLEYRFIEPLITWAVPTEQSSEIVSEPSLNPKALESLMAGGHILEEIVALSEELGLDLSEDVAVDELVSKLRSVRPEWDWQDDLTPFSLNLDPPLREVAKPGIYNRAAVIITERQPYTVGLEKELHALAATPDADMSSSILGALLHGSRTDVESAGQTPQIIEPAPLNAEQREAVLRSLTRPLTVITGPPGTGKSQVVTAIVLNAAFNGQRLLFSSKNHKAVDVVEDRVNGLAPQRILLRMGAREVNAELANHLGALLAQHPTKDDRQVLDDARRKLEMVESELKSCENDLQRLIDERNQVDALDEGLSGEVDLSNIAVTKTLSAVDVKGFQEKINTLREAIDLADRAKAGWLAGLLWPFTRRRRMENLQKAVSASSGTCQALAICDFDPTDLSALRAVCDRLEMRLRVAAKIQQLFRLESDLKALGDVGDLASRRTKALKRVQVLSRDVWASWMRLLPDRLSNNERKDLGDYVALLKMIVQAEGEETKLEKRLWSQYYSLAQKVATALPCWAVTSLSVRGRVPFSPALFDVVVIDEASQCDIASALPLLFRAKRAVIIGDPQQLRHISAIDAKRDQQLMDKFGVLSSPGPAWAYGTNSLYDLTASRVDRESIISLRDHHRSHEDIIAFSNETFYNGQLRVATDYSRLRRPSGQAVRWVNVVGTTYRPKSGGAGNIGEAQRVVSELKRLLVEQRFDGDVGVVTPFREQANKIRELVNADDALSARLASRAFLCETAHRFQGDERDVILFSPVLSREAPDTAKRFLARTQNLFNVAITRARGSLWVIGDKAACASSGVDYLEKFARYVDGLESANHEAHAKTSEFGPEYPEVANPELVSDWERVLYRALYSVGVRPIPQYSVDQYLLDLAIVEPSGRKLDIEVDGERYHRRWNGELTRRDQLRNMRLIEMGWDVKRFWVYQVRDDLGSCIDTVRRWVEQGPPAKTASSASSQPHEDSSVEAAQAVPAKDETRVVVNCPVCGREGIYKVCADCGYRTEPGYKTDESIVGSQNRSLYERS